MIFLMFSFPTMNSSLSNLPKEQELLPLGLVLSKGHFILFLIPSQVTICNTPYNHRDVPFPTTCVQICSPALGQRSRSTAKSSQPGVSSMAS